jgi:hypothetical protein
VDNIKNEKEIILGQGCRALGINKRTVIRHIKMNVVPGEKELVSIFENNKYFERKLCQIMTKVISINIL